MFGLACCNQFFIWDVFRENLYVLHSSLPLFDSIRDLYKLPIILFSESVMTVNNTNLNECMCQWSSLGRCSFSVLCITIKSLMNILITSPHSKNSNKFKYFKTWQNLTRGLDKLWPLLVLEVMLRTRKFVMVWISKFPTKDVGNLLSWTYSRVLEFVCNKDIKPSQLIDNLLYEYSISGLTAIAQMGIFANVLNNSFS